MKRYHGPKASPRQVAEPVQVYLAKPDRDRLSRLTTSLGATKSDVIRQGLEALESQLSSPAHHPVLGLVGIAQADGADGDVAREHDRVLADSEMEAWTPKKRRRRAR